MKAHFLEKYKGKCINFQKMGNKNQKIKNDKGNSQDLGQKSLWL